MRGSQAGVRVGGGEIFLGLWGWDLGQMLPTSVLSCGFGPNCSDVAPSVCEPELAVQRQVVKPGSLPPVHRGGLFPPSSLHLPPFVFALPPPSPMASDGTGARVAPPVALFVPGHSKSGVLGCQWRDALRLVEERGVGLATARGAGAAAGGMGELMWDRDVGDTHLVLPMGCAARALPWLGLRESSASW